jgi:hypothetical protein
MMAMPEPVLLTQGRTDSVTKVAVGLTALLGKEILGRKGVEVEWLASLQRCYDDEARTWA